MAYTYGILPLRTRFSEIGYDRVKTGKKEAKRQDSGEEYEYNLDHEILPSDDLADYRLDVDDNDDQGTSDDEVKNEIYSLTRLRALNKTSRHLNQAIEDFSWFSPEASHGRASKFSVELLAGKYLKLYKEICNA